MTLGKGNGKIEAVEEVKMMGKRIVKKEKRSMGVFFGKNNTRRIVSVGLSVEDELF